MNYDRFALYDVGTENLHIFKVKINIYGEVEYIFLQSQCQKIYERAIIKEPVFLSFMNHMRVFCAQKQKKYGVEICGQCVSTLYSDDDYLKLR